jgi:hypothetical protein
LWPIVYLIPAGFAAVSIWFIATDRTMELPVALADRLTYGLRQLAERMMFMRFRRRDAASEGAA